VDDDSLNAVGGHCPVCGQEYRPAFTVCADDGADLVPGPAPERSDDPATARGVRRTDVPDLGDSVGPPAVLGTYPEQDAVLLAGRLRASGVRAMAETDAQFDAYRLTAMNAGIRVLVAPEDLERAHRIARRILEGADDDA
jgi:hypothetical protein